MDRLNDSLGAYVAAARRCFARPDGASTTMADIAAEAGLSRQYLYRLVSSRDELVELALIDRAREFTDALAVRAAKEAGSGDIGTAITDQVLAAASMGRQDPEFLTLARRLPRERTNRVLTAADSPFHGYTVRAFEPLFDRARSDGVLRPDVSVDAMVDWLQGVLALIAGRDDLDEAAERALVRDFVLPGLLR